MSVEAIACGESSSWGIEEEREEKWNGRLLCCRRLKEEDREVSQVFATWMRQCADGEGHGEVYG